MKYGFEPRPARLTKRLIELEQEYRTEYARHCQIEEVIDVFRNTKLWHSSIGKVEYSTSTGSINLPDLYIRTYDYPVDIVINFFCSVIHQTFDVYWTMKAQSKIIQLETKIKKPFGYNFRLDLWIRINEGTEATCDLIKVPVSVYDEVPASVQYEYKIDCGNGEMAEAA